MSKKRNRKNLARSIIDSVYLFVNAMHYSRDMFGKSFVPNKGDCYENVMYEWFAHFLDVLTGKDTDLSRKLVFISFFTTSRADCRIAFDEFAREKINIEEVFSLENLTRIFGEHEAYKILSCLSPKLKNS